MNNLDQTQYDPEVELKARIKATLAHASACSKACQGMFDPVAEVAQLKALAGLTEELHEALSYFSGYCRNITRSRNAPFLETQIDKTDSLLARVRAVKGNRP